MSDRPERSGREPGAIGSPGTIPLSVPFLGGNEWKYVKECLDTNWVSSVGSFVDRFERLVAEAVGVSHAVATVNGTAALHIALQLAGVGPDDEVVMSDLTFIAPANAVRYLGAWPVFIDAEPRYWQLDPQKLHDFLRHECALSNGAVRNRHTGRRIAAILPVHILGQTCEIEAIVREADAFGIPVIEDATESLGASRGGKASGSFGALGCFSFNGNKILTTGGGGMVVTNDAQLAGRARYLTTQAKDDPLEFVHGEVGYNYRLVNVLAAIGVAQMERLSAHVAEKRAIAGRYEQAFRRIAGLSCPAEPENAFSTFWLYSILLDEALAGTSSRALLKHLESRGIQARPLWQPMHLSPAHRGSYAVDCSVAERLNREALSIPCSVGLSESDQGRVVDAVTEACATPTAGRGAVR